MKDVKFLGIDLGGTATKAAIVSKSGAIISKRLFPTRTELGYKKIIEDVVVNVKRLIDSRKSLRIKSVGVGVAGDIDQKKGLVRYSPNLMWKNVPLGKLLKSEFKRPVIIENDANAAAWGAFVVENKRRVKNLIAITLGTGVGGGIILDGKLYRGAAGSAGEIGHMTLFPEGPECKCGNRGCVERYLGATYLKAILSEKMKCGKDTEILHMVDGDIAKVTPIIIEKAAKKGDTLALEIYHDMGVNLGIALASLINLLNPEMIVISGGVSRAGELLKGTITEEIKERSFESARKSVKIIFSKNDRDTGVIGAALLE